MVRRFQDGGPFGHVRPDFVPGTLMPTGSVMTPEVCSLTEPSCSGSRPCELEDGNGIPPSFLDRGARFFSRPSWASHDACEGIPRYTLGEDCRAFPRLLMEDAKAASNWNNAALVGVAFGGAILIRQDLDERVRQSTARHPNRWGSTTETFGLLGNPEYQVAFLAGSYGYSLWTQDSKLHDVNRSLFSAYALTGATTLLIKVIADTDRPSERWHGGRYGFPSHHASSSFAMAAVLDEHYGARVGIPAYAVAGLIGWSRIDERAHDLSDVLFGAALGYVIGKSVAGHHLHCDGRVRLCPYIHPTDGSTGIMCELPF